MQPSGPREVRVALVLNGGVSLAVWMSGVVREIDLICRASREEPPPDDASEAERSHHATWREITQACRTTVVVDIIAGTSAGGLNGTILATALACGQPLPDLKQMWRSSAALTEKALLWPPGSATVPSMLRGRFFENTISEVLGPIVQKADEVEAAAAAAGDPVPEPPDVTLFVTATALGPSDVGYRDATGRRFEVADHRRLYRFRSRTPHPGPSAGGPADRGPDDPAGLNDFTRWPRIPALVRAARASASYPAAFEPVQEIADLIDLRYPPETYSALDTEPRYLMDGGILDNAPLGPVIEEVMRRTVDGRITRVVAYVVPSNGIEPRERDTGSAGHEPDWLTVIGAALDMPRESDFRDDVAQLTDALGAARTRARTSLTLLESALTSAEKQAALVAAAAVLLPPYRASRIEGSLRQIRAGLAASGREAPILATPPAALAEADQMPADAVGEAAWVPAPQQGAAAFTASEWRLGFSGALRIVRLLLAATRARIEAGEDDLGSLASDLSLARNRTADLYSTVVTRVYGRFGLWRDEQLINAINEAYTATDAITRLTDIVHSAVTLYAGRMDVDPDRLGEALAAIEVITGAAAGDTEEQDPPPFEFLRIGPDIESRLFPDAEAKGGAKLYGTSLGHFGAFGRAEWRDCDYTWGRLDAAAHIASFLGLRENDALKIENEVIAAEGWRNPSAFDQTSAAAGADVSTTLDMLRDDADGRKALQGLADSVPRFLAQPNTRLASAGHLLRVCLTPGQWPRPTNLSEVLAWASGVLYLRRALRRRLGATVTRK
jgi:predicted acylesterase/phospholipase RssA